MKKLILSLFCIFTASFLFSQQNFILVERTDLRRYDNNKYVGLLSREVRSFICPSVQNKDLFYEGFFYIQQDTKRSNQIVASGIHDAILSAFKIDSEGYFQMITDNGFPSFRAFPVIPAEELSIGDIWEAESERSVDPLEKGIPTKMKILVQYEYTNDIVFHGIDVYVVKAKWATRYDSFKKIFDEEGDKDLLSASGMHEATIYVDKQTLNALLIQDKVDEIFNYSDGKKIAFKGNIAIFTEYPQSVNKEEILEKIDSQKDNIVTEKTKSGLKLTIPDLNFKPDSSELLETETERLDKIASLLKLVPDSEFLVEGHTARTGIEEGEMELSIKRSYTIINELIKRGINPDSFICKGWGGTKPIADNDTPEGRAKNRRVEITILE